MKAHVHLVQTILLGIWEVMSDSPRKRMTTGGAMLFLGVFCFGFFGLSWFSLFYVLLILKGSDEIVHGFDTLEIQR